MPGISSLVASCDLKAVDGFLEVVTRWSKTGGKRKEEEEETKRHLYCVIVQNCYNTLPFDWLTKVCSNVAIAV